MTQSDQSQWFTDLLSQQQALLSSTLDFSAVPGMREWMDAVTSFTRWQTEAWSALSAPWLAMFGGTSEPVKDRRFTSEAWTKDPRFDTMSRTYLAQVDVLNKALDAAPLDARTKGQWSFAMRQVMDALSPANNLMTNPEAQKLALETGGQSLIDGMRLFTEDLAKGKLSITDEAAFEVGENVATTPGTVVFENELMQLIQYTPTTDEVFARPLLIVPPCINKFYILDLQPKNSFVAHAVAQGHTVFLVSWVNAGPELGGKTWDDYLADGVLKGLEVALAITKADKANTLGFCIGGTLLASSLAVLAAKGDERAASMTLLTTMLDFSDTGEIGLLVDEQGVVQRENSIGKGGLLQGSELSGVFSSLRANDLVWPYVVKGYLQGQAPPAFDLLYWNSDDTNLPGPMFAWYLRNTYLENKICNPGATVQLGEPVDLGAIDVPSFLYASRADHIVPWQTAYLSTQVVGGQKTFVLGASGHIAGVINPPASGKRNYWIVPDIDNNYPHDPDLWLDQAESVPGSWWPVFYDFAAATAGEKKPAPKKPGSTTYKAIEPAPGRYVKTKAPKA